MDITRAIATAKRLIDANGQSVIWRKPFRAAPVGSPWRDVDAGDPDDTPVKVLWVTPKLRRLSFLALMANSEVTEGVEEVLLAAQGFEPEATDIIVVGGVERKVTLIVDRLSPNGMPVLYRIRVER